MARSLFANQEIQVNYTIATGSDPDVKIASTNCHNSHVLLRNYELDTTNQEANDELAQVRADITMYENLVAFTNNLINSQALVGPADSWGRVTLLSPKPSPPPPPPPVPELDNAWTPRHPPAPPELVSGRTLVKRYEDWIIDLEAREAELVIKLDDCFVRDRAAGTVCGLNSNEAPRAIQPVLGLARVPSPPLHALRPPPFSWAGTAPVDGARRRQVPRLRHALDARGRLLRILGERHQPDGGQEQEGATGIALGRPLLHDRDRLCQRRGRAFTHSSLLLAQLDPNPKERRQRRGVHDPARPRVLARLLQLEPHTHTHACIPTLH